MSSDEEILMTLVKINPDKFMAEVQESCKSALEAKDTTLLHPYLHPAYLHHPEADKLIDETLDLLSS